MSESKFSEYKDSADDAKMEGKACAPEMLSHPTASVADHKLKVSEYLKYCSTSTVFARYTISNPDFSQVNYCIAAILQAQVFDDYANPEFQVNSHQEFFLQPLLSPDMGGDPLQIDPFVLNCETMNDEELRTKIVAGQVPLIDTIYKYVYYLFQRAQFSIECNILALIYINRMTTRNKIALTMRNWRGFWTAAVMLAQKVWDDRPLRTSSFVTLLPQTTKMQLRDMEITGLTLLEFSTIVKPSTYAKYYFELRKLYQDIVGNDNVDTWAIPPMSMAEGQMLEERTGRMAVMGKFQTSSAGSTRGGGGSSRSGALSSASSSTYSLDPNRYAASSLASFPTTTVGSAEMSHRSISPSPHPAGLVLGGTSVFSASGHSKTLEDLQPLTSHGRYVIN